jgi:hypothetical protein
MKIGDMVTSTLCNMTGKIVAILGDNTGMVEVKGRRIYTNFNYWIKTGE